MDADKLFTMMFHKLEEANDGIGRWPAFDEAGSKLSAAMYHDSGEHQLEQILEACKEILQIMKEWEAEQEFSNEYEIINDAVKAIEDWKGDQQ